MHWRHCSLGLSHWYVHQNSNSLWWSLPYGVIDKDIIILPWKVFIHDRTHHNEFSNGNTFTICRALCAMKQESVICKLCTSYLLCAAKSIFRVNMINIKPLVTSTLADTAWIYDINSFVLFWCVKFNNVIIIVLRIMQNAVYGWIQYKDAVLPV